MGSGTSTPAQPPVVATEATVVTKIRSGNYPALLNINADFNEDGSGLTWATTLMIAGVTVLLVLASSFLYKKIQKCRQKKKDRETAKEAATAEILHAIYDVQGQVEVRPPPPKITFDNDRFEEINELRSEIKELRSPRPIPVYYPVPVGPPAAEPRPETSDLPPAEAEAPMEAVMPAGAAIPQGQRNPRRHR